MGVLAPTLTPYSKAQASAASSAVVASAAADAEAEPEDVAAAGVSSSASAAPFLPSSYQYSVLCTEVLKHDYLKRFDFQTLRTAFKLQYLPRVHGFRLKRFDKTCKLSILSILHNYAAGMRTDIIQPHQWQETSLHCRGFLQFLLQVFGLFSFLCDLFLPQHKPLK